MITPPCSFKLLGSRDPPISASLVAGTTVNPQPVSTPSWQIETKYSTRVLTGNWVEERRKFTRDTDKTPQSIHKKEYVPFPDHRPDQISRWYGKRKVEGLPYKHLITHHQEPPHRYLISTYDDHYNRHGYNPGLPPLRTWNGQKLLWLPEKSDYPLLAPPTNYGLFEQLKQRWLAPKAGLKQSTYTSSYPRPPLCAMSSREHAIPVPPRRLHPVPHF
uniref:Cilia and flagella associated protein 107 n=1 Tax=Callithrix jacchus TaxID=9483 RepID=A0A5F4W1W3_CALJA|nr:cilia- and flagella-associated protein 107 isoform X1 [Callithrix jacchus]